MTAMDMDKDLEHFEKHCLEFLRVYFSMKTTAELGERGAFLSKPKQSTSGSRLSTEEVIVAVLQHHPGPGRQLEGVVPAGLPQEVRERASEMTAESLAECYNLDRAVKLVEERELTRLELVSMHLRSYRNVLDLELSDQSPLRSRFMCLLNRVFTYLLDRVYIARGDNSPVRY